MSRSRPLRSAPSRRPSARRGSALITVILVALVLTVVGLGIAYFASTEDKTSGNTEMARVGFYAAEAGLRDAEARVSDFAQLNNSDATELIDQTYSSGAAIDARPWPAGDVYTPPGGGRPAYVLEIAGTKYRDIVIPQDLGNPSTRAMYSVFVRNNEEDTAGGNNADTDKKINIVVVGQMVLVDPSTKALVLRDGVPTIGITKVLEEQLYTEVEGSASATQKGTNVGGTSSGAK
ncbi:MAG: pilus assembly PilX family protein [Thermoanaerobaculia bacterium]